MKIKKYEDFKDDHLNEARIITKYEFKAAAAALGVFGKHHMLDELSNAIAEAVTPILVKNGYVVKLKNI